MSTATARRLMTLVTVLGMGFAVLLTFAPGGEGAQPAAPRAATSARPHPATLKTFTREWTGHARSLRIRKDRIARESVYSGCCERAADLKFRISKPRGTTAKGSVRAVLVKVRFWDRTIAGPRPRVGRVVRFRLHRGVLVEPVVGTNYCNGAAGRRGACGA